MTRTQACRILGIDEDADRTEVKKKYRKLMHLVHPDAGAAEHSIYRYTAQEINEAYAILYKREAADTPGRGRTARKKKQQPPKWNAPVNEYAYAERNVYHYVEDADGEILGEMVVARGKFLWKVEEDFPLFLKSMYVCSGELLDDVDRKCRRKNSREKRMAAQAKLTYLLAQQYIDGVATLGMLITPEEKEQAVIFPIAAMLEPAEDAPILKAGTPLYPAAVRQHRLYLKTGDGQMAGYLSFRDDRLYYIVIPLLEQRRVQVKAQISRKQDAGNRKKNRRYQNLDFWVKLVPGDTGTFPESIGLQIDALLREYAM